MNGVKGERNSLYLLTVLAKNKYTYKIKKKRILLKFYWKISILYGSIAQVVRAAHS